MTRVIVHAGFHKTGTTSLQTYLARNRKALKPWFDYYGKAEFLQAGAAARIYGQRRFAWRRRAFRRAFRRFLDTIPRAGTIVLSRETFAGAMPGHRDFLGRTLTSYTPAAVPLAREITRALRRRFGPDTVVEFLYTIRERESWLRSVYGHLLRSIHLTEDYEVFRATLADTPDLREQANAIAAALQPVPVHMARLEDFSDHPAGPAGAVLVLAGVPDDLAASLPPARHEYRGQSPQMQAEFLALNRSGRSKAELKALKAAMIAEAAKERTP